MREIHKVYLSLKDADDEQSKFANKLKSIDKGIKSIVKKLFLINIGLFFTARQNVLNNFKNRLFPIKKFRTEIRTGIRTRITTGIRTGTKT